MSVQNNILENEPLEFDFALCHGNPDYNTYRYCRICA